MSLTGEAAAEARRRAAATFGYYNLRFGPLAWRFEAAAGIQYHDNISYAEANRRVDFILRPQVNTAMRWTITEKNSLNINFGLGYLKYVKYSEFDRFYIEPGSEIGFDLYVGDFLFNFHDRVTIQTDVGEIPTASSRGDYQRLENVIGVTAHWDLNTIILTLGYDHADYLSLNSTLRLADGSSETVFAQGSLALSSESTIGPELGVTTVDYQDSRVNDAVQYSAGLFYQSKLTRHIDLKLRAGYTFYETQAGGFVQAAPGSGNPYADLSVSHLVGAFMSHSLSIGHHVRSGMEYGSRTRPLVVTYANWNPTWKFLREVQLTTPVSFQYRRGDRRRPGTVHLLHCGLVRRPHVDGETLWQSHLPVPHEGFESARRRLLGGHCFLAFYVPILNYDPVYALQCFTSFDADGGPRCPDGAEP